MIRTIWSISILSAEIYENLHQKLNDSESKCEFLRCVNACFEVLDDSFRIDYVLSCEIYGRIQHRHTEYNINSLE